MRFCASISSNKPGTSSTRSWKTPSKHADSLAATNNAAPGGSLSMTGAGVARTEAARAQTRIPGNVRGERFRRASHANRPEDAGDSVAQITASKDHQQYLKKCERTELLPRLSNTEHLGCVVMRLGRVGSLIA